MLKCQRNLKARVESKDREALAFLVASENIFNYFLLYAQSRTVVLLTNEGIGCKIL